MIEIDTHKHVSKSFVDFLTGTLISRITGMIRDLSMAFCFGTTPEVAAFLLAFRLSNLLRRLLGDGALLNGFIPFFESIRRKDPFKGALFFRDLFWNLCLLIVITVVALEAILGAFLWGVSLSASTAYIIQMSMIMLPGLLFIAFFGISMALLECEKNFFVPGCAPTAFNIVWIFAIWFSKDYPIEQAMIVNSFAIVFAFLLQWVMTLPGVLRYLREFLSIKQWFSLRLCTEEIKEMIAPICMGVIGVAAMQVNSAFDVIIARFSSLEGPAYLSYAHRLQQLPLALFGIAIASALTPPLARAIKKDDFKHLRSLILFGFRKTFLLLFPGTIAIFVLGSASINMLYGRGLFTDSSIIYTTYCLWGYGAGLVPMAFVILLAPVFYARRDFWTPTLGSIYTVLLNVFLNFFMIFVCEFGAMSVAIATSMSAVFNMRFLLRRLHIRIFHKLSPYFLKVSIAAIGAGCITAFLGVQLLQDPIVSMFSFDTQGITFAKSFSGQLQHFFFLFTIYASLFAFFTYMLGVSVIKSFFRKTSS